MCRDALLRVIITPAAERRTLSGPSVCPRRLHGARYVFWRSSDPCRCRPGPRRPGSPFFILTPFKVSADPTVCAFSELFEKSLLAFATQALAPPHLPEISAWSNDVLERSFLGARHRGQLAPSLLFFSFYYVTLGTIQYIPSF